MNHFGLDCMLSYINKLSKVLIVEFYIVVLTWVSRIVVFTGFGVIYYSSGIMTLVKKCLRSYPGTSPRVFMLQFTKTFQ